MKTLADRNFIVHAIERRAEAYRSMQADVDLTIKITFEAETNPGEFFSIFINDAKDFRVGQKITLVFIAKE